MELLRILQKNITSLTKKIGEHNFLAEITLIGRKLTCNEFIEKIEPSGHVLVDLGK